MAGSSYPPASSDSLESSTLPSYFDFPPNSASQFPNYSQASTDTYPALFPLEQQDQSESQADLANFQAQQYFMSAAKSGDSDVPSPKATSFSSTLSPTISPSKKLYSHSGADANEHSLASARRSSADGEPLQELKLRKREQNRAAQRAFRERREQHIKNLRSSISELESSSTFLLEENVRMKSTLKQVTAENEILRSSSDVRTPRSRTGSVDERESDFASPRAVVAQRPGVRVDNDVSAGSAMAAAQSFLATR